MDDKLKLNDHSNNQQSKQHDSASDGYASEPEVDGHKDDKDFKNKIGDNIAAREKSARIQARKSKKKGSGDNSEEDTDADASARSSTDKEAQNIESDSKNDSEEDLADERQRKPQNFSVSQMPVEKQTKRKSMRDFFGDDEAIYIMDAKRTGNIGRYLNVTLLCFC